MKEIVYKIRGEGFDELNKSVSDLENNLREVKEIAEVTNFPVEKLDKFDNEIKKINDELTKFEKNLIDVEEATDNFSSTGQRAEGIAKTLAGAVSLTAGAFATFGVESENVEKTLLKVQGAIAISQGIKDLSEGFNILTKSFKGLNLALLSNPFVLITAGIIGLLGATGNLDDILKVIGDSFGVLFTELQPILDILIDIIKDAVGPLGDILKNLLIPVIKLTLIPIQTLTKILPLLVPIFELVGETVEFISDIFGDLTESVSNLIESFFGLFAINDDIVDSNDKVRNSFDKLTEAEKMNNKVKEDKNKTSKDFIKNSEEEVKAIEANLTKQRDAIKLASDLELVQLKEKLVKKQITQKQFDELALSNVQKLNNDELKLLQTFRTTILNNVKLTEEDKNKLIAKFGAEALKVRSSISDGVIKANQDETKRIQEEEQKRKDNAKKAYDENLKNVQDNITKQRDLLILERDRELLVLKESLANRLISQKDFDAEVLKLNDELTQKQIQLFEKQTDSELKKLGVNQSDRRKIIENSDKEILKLKTQVADQTIAINKKTDEDDKKRREDEEKRENERLKRVAEKRLESVDRVSLVARQKLFNEFNEGRIKSEELYNIEVKKIELERQKDLLNSLDKTSNEYLQKKLEISQLEKEIIDETDKYELEQEKKKQDDIKKILSDYLTSLQSIVQQTSENFDGIGFTILGSITNLSDGFQKLFSAINDESLKSRDKIAAAFGFGGEVINQLGGILSENSNKRIQQLNEEADLRIQSLEKQKEAGIINEQQLADATDKINKEKNKKELELKRKAFKQEKAIRIAQATAQTAQAALNAYSSGAATPFIGPATGAIFAGIATAFGLAQIGIISRQKFPEGEGDTVGGSISTSISTPSSSQTPTQTTFNPNTFGTNVSQQQTLTQEGRLQNVRVFVTENDITNTQNRINTIKGITTL